MEVLLYLGKMIKSQTHIHGDGRRTNKISCILYSGKTYIVRTYAVIREEVTDGLVVKEGVSVK